MISGGSNYVGATERIHYSTGIVARGVINVYRLAPYMYRVRQQLIKCDYNTMTQFL